MIDNEGAGGRAVAAAIAGAVDQSRLDAGVNITDLLLDLSGDSPDDLDSRQYFMCWHLTRVFAPSVAEMVPPAVVRNVVSRKQTPLHTGITAPHCELRSVESPPATSPESGTAPPPDRHQSINRDLEKNLWWLALSMLNAGGWCGRGHQQSARDGEPPALDAQARSGPRSPTGSGRIQGHYRPGGSRTAVVNSYVDTKLILQYQPNKFRSFITTNPHGG